MEQAKPDKKVGFSVKIDRQNNAGARFQVPSNTGETLDIEKGEKFIVELRNMDGEEKVEKLKVQTSNSYFRFYIPKGVAENLELDTGDLLDVFLRRP